MTNILWLNSTIVIVNNIALENLLVKRTDHLIIRGLMLGQGGGPFREVVAEMMNFN